MNTHPPGAADSTVLSFDREAGFRALFDHSTVATLIVNRERTIEAINPAAVTLFGYCRNELHGKLLDCLVPESLREAHILQHKNYYTNPVAREMSHGNEVSARKKDGAVFPAFINLCAYHTGKEMHVIAFVTDISERKKAREQRFAAENRIRMLIEHAPAAIAMLATEMRYIIVSNRWLKDYRLGNRSITGKNHYETLPELPLRWKKLHRRALAGEILRSDEDMFQRTDGSVEWLRWELCPWYAEDGGIGGLIIFSEIITEQKMGRQALEKLNAELEDKVKERTVELISLLEHEKELNEIKSRFVSTASHEFRTPLSVILSSIQFIESYSRPGQEEKRGKHIERIKSSVKNLTELLNDFLSLEKLEQERVETSPSSFNLHHLCQDLADELLVTLKQGQQIIVAYEGAPDVCQDKKIVRNILVNLLSNAIKYSPLHGIIRIRAVHTANHIVIQVMDEGIGIPEAEQKNIFSKFYRASNAVNIQGTGLGLNIVQRYAELLGGSISFESRSGEGSVFTLEFPEK